MTDETILIERPDTAVRVIRLHRPEKKNAITRAMYLAMTDALAAAEAEDEVRVIVFLGTPGCFSAGNDMADFAQMAMSNTLGAEVLGFLRALATAQKPLVSGVDGLAIGIGTTLHLHCDLTVVSTRTQLRTPFVDLALVPEAASSLLVPRIVGHQRAFALLAAGLPIAAEEAVAAGLVWKAVAPEMLEQETLAAAALLAAKPPQALRIARQLLRGDSTEILARIDIEAEHFAARLKSAEAQAAFMAFLARR
ncbi:enoyl-CoA hydratase [Rhizobium sp. Leaf384]|uniref:crotonase/enoyl-CoA hydratase family protein n=1 Tax=unclassified Rhizobium TaxID=2613769 RepID=UPI0007133AD3|nr:MULTISPECIES: crotonase/enoyl-CoA hydratase family protein [unclassified Rhizobium]KQS77363.1 enoyl-CoA hydratase [Rhizobium sp. Leaf383]KQS80729.1 enoyl-CoA hydratase [Rhizobium sp. Leaf384]